MVGQVSPLSHKVSEGHTFDDPGGAKLEMECLKRDVPFCNSPGSVRAPEHPLQRVCRNDFDGVALEVVVQLSGGDKERKQEFLRHGVTCMCLL